MFTGLCCSTACISICIELIHPKHKNLLKIAWTYEAHSRDAPLKSRCVDCIFFVHSIFQNLLTFYSIGAHHWELQKCWNNYVNTFFLRYRNVLLIINYYFGESQVEQGHVNKIMLIVLFVRFWVTFRWRRSKTCLFSILIFCHSPKEWFSLPFVSGPTQCSLPKRWLPSRPPSLMFCAAFNLINNLHNFFIGTSPLIMHYGFCYARPKNVQFKFFWILKWFRYFPLNFLPKFFLWVKYLWPFELQLTKTTKNDHFVQEKFLPQQFYSLPLNIQQCCLRVYHCVFVFTYGQTFNVCVDARMSSLKRPDKKKLSFLFIMHTAHLNKAPLFHNISPRTTESAHYLLWECLNEWQK